jgi:mannose/fructose/N-acetylgalactosamine-specific phosphotransferase system component IID
MDLTRGETHRLGRRLLFLQTLLNYRTMQGGGFLFALWPFLRRRQANHDEVRGAASYLNAQPVFAALALGALRRRLEDGDASRSAEDFAAWKNSLCGPLGMAGDMLIWDRWKPLVWGLAALIVLIVPDLATWAIVAAAALLVYNTPLHILRLWGIREGYRRGVRVLDVLQKPIWARMRKTLTVLGSLAAGWLLAAGLIRSRGESWLPIAQFAIAFGLTWLLLRWNWKITWATLTSAAAAITLAMIFH